MAIKKECNSVLAKVVAIGLILLCLITPSKAEVSKDYTIATTYNYADLITARAEQEIGKGESTANNCGKDIKRYMQGIEKQSWCAGFVSYILFECGYKNLGFNYSAKQIWNKGKQAGLVVKNAQRGDLICFWRGNKNSWKGHIGIIYKVENNSIITIEGNKGSFPAKVKTVRYYKNNVPKLLGYLRIKEVKKL